MTEVRLNHIEHVGMTVANLQSVIDCYTKRGCEVIRHLTEKPDLGLRLAMIQLEGLHYEIIEPLIPSRTLLHRVGTCHFAIGVDDLTGTYKQLKNDGVKFIEELVEKGAYFYEGPDGVLIELRQRK